VRSAVARRVFIARARERVPGGCRRGGRKERRQGFILGRPGWDVGPILAPYGLYACFFFFFLELDDKMRIFFCVRARQRAGREH